MRSGLWVVALCAACGGSSDDEGTDLFRIEGVQLAETELAPKQRLPRAAGEILHERNRERPFLGIDPGRA